MNSQTKPTIAIASPFSRLVANKNDPSIDIFLGDKNREHVHNMIVKSVYEKTDGKVKLAKQSDNEVKMVMIHTLQMQYNAHRPIQDLNKMVVQHCTQNIIQNIGHYVQYIKDMNAPGPMSASQSVMDLLLPANTRESRERSNKPIY